MSGLALSRSPRSETNSVWSAEGPCDPSPRGASLRPSVRPSDLHQIVFHQLLLCLSPPLSPSSPPETPVARACRKSA